MVYKNRVPVLAALAVIFTGIAVCGGLSADEPVLGLGIAAAFVCLILIPAFHLRATRLKKISEKENPLIRFEYAPDEINEIATVQRQIVYKKSVKLSVFLSISLAIIFAPFVMFSLQPEPTLPSVLPIAVPCVLLPWISLIIAPYVVEKSIRIRPCISLVGHDYVLIANRYPGVNDRFSLKAERVRYEKGTEGSMGSLGVCYSFKAMRYHTTTISLWVRLPVPHGREEDAAALRLEKYT
jgi:uncharacterized membrane protein YjgN (DUF898 family)